MTGKRQSLLGAARIIGAARGLKQLHDRGRTGLVVLAYHRIQPPAHNETFPFDPGLVSADVLEFAGQMDVLAQEYRPIALSQAVDCMVRGEAFPERAVVVTFDDGFADVHDAAFPVLRSRGIPAAVFLATGYVGSDQPFWFETVSLLMMRLPCGALRVGDQEQGYPLGDSVSQRRRSCERLLSWMKALPDERRKLLVCEWSERYKDHIDEQTRALSRALNWEQVREMAATGIEFGSHSVSHPNLARVADAELEHELGDSLRVLKSQATTALDVLAYPIGTADAFDDRVIAAAARAGYRAALTYDAGMNWSRPQDPFRLRRMGIGPGLSLDGFRAVLDFPSWV